MIYFYDMIFVTGGTGLIGSHLLFALAKKRSRIRALKRKNSNTEEIRKVFSYYTENAEELFSKIEWVEGDVLDITSLEQAMEGVSQVYHCAAVVSLRAKDQKKMLRENPQGTANMVNAALEKKVEKFCHVSSVAAIGIAWGGMAVTEETSWNELLNFSPYSVSKYATEREVWRASEEGLPVVIVNPSIVIGPGNWRRSSGSIFFHAWKGNRWYSTGSAGYVDVRDVANAMIQLMENSIVNQRFIVSSENISFKNFLNMVHEGLGKKPPSFKAGKLLLEMAWRTDALMSFLRGVPPKITQDIARYASLNISYSNEKIRQTLNFNFIPISKSIQDTCQHFIAEINNTASMT